MAHKIMAGVKLLLLVAFLLLLVYVTLALLNPMATH